MIWFNILSKKEKSRILSENYQRFYEIALNIMEKKYSRSCVFGTGPSLEKAYDFDFSGCLTIVCNSIVQNKKLLKHTKPTFICAGDVVSHLGISLYAEKFREDLLNVLKSNTVYFLTSASFGYLLILNHPEVRDKTILIDQTVPGPNYNLIHGFGLPLLASTLNIHMLPLASSFTNEIFLLGCDGKSSKKEENEDFWAHAKDAQYHNLVDSGHLCHPTFNIHREQKTYKRYAQSLESFITNGEKNYGKTFWTLQPSNMEILKSRLVPGAQGLGGQNDRISIAGLRVRKKANFKSKDVNKDLPIRTGLSRFIPDRDGSFFIQGWILSPLPVDRIDIFANKQFLGTTMLEYGTRPDVYNRHPEYEEKWIGFRFFGENNTGDENLDLVIKFFSNGKMIKELNKRIKKEKE